ncbi:MAG TPA: arsenosugar biosynthesis radical SAM (seleno)protein ArsS [Bryobacteraceae bacterium]|nr:arsenosugar biosynthesis radical SAM (seleno)protein ArsS [Bryobacteraceae bacterium]
MTPNFQSTLAQHGISVLERHGLTTLQINVGKVCNQACQHCHVDAGPKRTESMATRTAERVLTVLGGTTGVGTVDITGGAPELNPNFRLLVEECIAQGRHVIDRCNLTILFEAGYEGLAEFLARHRVEITASLPCYTAANVDKQRGRGVFEKSIRALQLLNGVGYGVKPGLTLNLVYNPLGPSLPPRQEALEADYKRHLREEFGIEFNRLFTITNMPIQRFAQHLVHLGKKDEYLRLLADHFNPSTVDQLMCRSLVSVGWDGQLYDCDFNQMLELPIRGHPTIWNIDTFDELPARPVQVGNHCFGCTAGAGSSCGGELTK